MPLNERAQSADSQGFFQVPANRFGSSVLYLKESLRWNHPVAFIVIVGAAYFMFKRGSAGDPG